MPEGCLTGFASGVDARPFQLLRIDLFAEREDFFDTTLDVTVSADPSRIFSIPVQENEFVGWLREMTSEAGRAAIHDSLGQRPRSTCHVS